MSMARGASFDPDLEHRIGQAMGIEIRAQGCTLSGAVCINLLRHPAWGRAQETYGEDPHHVGVMGAALGTGIQAHNVIATAKHFALNSMENARFKVDVRVDERTLHEIYLPHFKACVDAALAGQGMFEPPANVAPDLFIEVAYGTDTTGRLDPASRETFLQLSARENASGGVDRGTGPEVWDVRVAVMGISGRVESAMPLLCAVAANYIATDTHLETKVEIPKNSPMIVAVRGGLTAAEILGRTRGSVAWMLFYGNFVVAVAIHAPIGLRTVLAEMHGGHGRGIDVAMLAFALVLLALGWRAVAAVTLGRAA